ncbi:hypothetical protein ACWGOQ_0013200 [Aquimarina sp. M1]
MYKNLNCKLINKYDLDIGSFYFDKNFVISEIKNGIIFSAENSAELYQLIENHYHKTTSFFYIANRKNFYSFNPIGHFRFIELFPNAKAYAVVVYDQKNRQIAEYEKYFVRASTDIFDNLEEVILWGKEIIFSD